MEEMSRERLGAMCLAATVAMLVSTANAGSIRYPALGNVRLEEGTLEFWFTPAKELYPDIGKSKYIGVFSLFSFAVKDHFGMGSGWGVRSDGSAVLFVSMSAKGKPKALLPVPARIKGWKRGEKHHIAFTWRGKAMKLYADGELVSKRDQAISLSGPLAGTHLVLGSRKGRTSGITIHAFRSSCVARDERMLKGATPEPDIYTLLLDRFGEPKAIDFDAGTTKARQISGLTGEIGGKLTNVKRLVEKPEPGLAL